MTTAVHTRTHEGFPKVPLGLDFLRLFPPFSDLLFLLGHLIHPPRFSPLPSFPSSLARYIVVVLEGGGGGGKKRNRENNTRELWDEIYSTIRREYTAGSPPLLCF